MGKKLNSALNASVRNPLNADRKTNRFVGVILLAALYIVLFLLDNFLPQNSFTLMMIPVLKKGAIYSLLCVSMNLLNGFTGLFSLGQAGFMLLGAYTYAIISIPESQHDAVYQYFNGGAIRFSFAETIGSALGENVGAWLGTIIAIIIAGLVAAFFAALIGIPVLRLKSDYLAIATLGFAEIIRAVFQWEGLGVVTNGSNLLRKYTSFSNIRIGSLNLITLLPFLMGFVLLGIIMLFLTSSISSTFRALFQMEGIGAATGSLNLKIGSLSCATLFPFLIVTICIIIIVLLINSSYGRAFKAIRDDEVAAEAMGINLFRHKMLSFVISSFFAGVGGALLAMYQTTIQASAFKTAMTYEILLMVVIGGIGSITGSCIAAFLYTACNEWWLRFLDSGHIGSVSVPFFRDGFRKVIFSIIIMVIVLFFSRGIMGDRELSFSGLLRRLKKKQPAAEPEEGGSENA